MIKDSIGTQFLTQAIIFSSISSLLVSLQTFSSALSH